MSHTVRAAIDECKKGKYSKLLMYSKGFPRMEVQETGRSVGPQKKNKRIDKLKI